MAVRIEDAGFEIRDMIAWVYGSGFPKSLDVSKAIDKAAGAEREIIGEKMRPDGKSVLSARGGDESRGDGWDRPWRNDPDAVARNGMETAPATDAARQWSGWGTALKPALEPITVARKPLVGTVAANVLEHGTGALNIDGCRVAGESTARHTFKVMSSKGAKGGALGNQEHNYAERDAAFATGSDSGRWPANLILSYNEDEFELRPGVTAEQRKALLKYLYENT